MEKCTVFYSWQSDLPSKTNRGFILTALEKAVKAIRIDDSIEVDPVVDRDTDGVPGSPDIAGTILSKIDAAQVFVCDVSIINNGSERRPTPNPNVLVELGYALKRLGPSRIIMVLNTEYGSPELLPFDLKTKRVTSYRMPEEADDRATERKQLESALTEQLRNIFTDIDLTALEGLPPTIAEQAISAIESSRPNQAARVRDYMAWLASEINALTPQVTGQNDDDDLLIEAIQQTTPFVVEFARVAQTIAEMNSSEAAEALYKGFSPILEGYNNPSGFSGPFLKSKFDLHKFSGHELLVTFFAFLIREERWEIVADLFDQRIVVNNADHGHRQAVPFTFVSTDVLMLNQRNSRLRANLVSMHATLLNQRHSDGEIGRLVPMRAFVEADYFLFLRAEIEQDSVSNWSMTWPAWSTLYIGYQPPVYLAEAISQKYAVRLLGPLGVPSVEIFRERLIERAPNLRRLFARAAAFAPLEDFKLEHIGTR